MYSAAARATLAQRNAWSKSVADTWNSGTIVIAAAKTGNIDALVFAFDGFCAAVVVALIVAAWRFDQQRNKQISLALAQDAASGPSAHREDLALALEKLDWMPAASATIAATAVPFVCATVVTAIAL